MQPPPTSPAADPEFPDEPPDEDLDEDGSDGAELEEEREEPPFDMGSHDPAFPGSESSPATPGHIPPNTVNITDYLPHDPPDISAPERDTLPKAPAPSERLP